MIVKVNGEAVEASRGTVRVTRFEAKPSDTSVTLNVRMRCDIPNDNMPRLSYGPGELVFELTPANPGLPVGSMSNEGAAVELIPGERVAVNCVYKLRIEFPPGDVPDIEEFGRLLKIMQYEEVDEIECENFGSQPS